MTKRKPNTASQISDLQLALRFATMEIPDGWRITQDIVKGSHVVTLWRRVDIPTSEINPAGIVSDAVREAQRLESDVISNEPSRPSVLRKSDKLLSRGEMIKPAHR